MKYKNKNSQAGITLFEMLLTVIVLGVSTLVVVDVMEGEARESLYEKNANYINMIMDAAYAATDTAEEFSNLYAVVDSVGGVMEVPIVNTAGVNMYNINIQNGGNAAVPVPFLPVAANVTIPANSVFTGMPNFNETMPLGAQVSVIYQILDNRGNPNDERNLGIYVFSINRITDKDIRPAAGIIGENSAYISNNNPGGTCLGVGCNQTIRSIYDTWRIDVNTLVGTRLLADIAGYGVGNTRQGYLGMYRFVNESDVAGDYLYRTPQVSMPELNAMYVDLDLANNNIVGADDVHILGNYSINNPVDIHVQGSVFAGSSLHVEGADVIVDGDMEASTLELAPDYDDTNLNVGTITRNLIQIQDLVDVNDLTINRVSAISGNFNTVTTPNFLATGMVVDNLDATASAVGVRMDTGGVIETVNTGITTTTNAITTDVTDTMTVTNPIRTNDAIIFDDVQVDGDINTQDARIRRMRIDRLEDCVSGC